MVNGNDATSVPTVGLGISEPVVFIWKTKNDGAAHVIIAMVDAGANLFAFQIKATGSELHDFIMA